MNNQEKKMHVNMTCPPPRKQVVTLFHLVVQEGQAFLFFGCHLGSHCPSNQPATSRFQKRVSPLTLIVMKYSYEKNAARQKGNPYDPPQKSGFKAKSTSLIFTLISSFHFSSICSLISSNDVVGMILGFGNDPWILFYFQDFEFVWWNYQKMQKMAVI